jgi:hypothetical protein
MVWDPCAIVSWCTHEQVPRMVQGTRATPVELAPHGGVVVTVLFIVGYLRFRSRDDMEQTYA